MDKKEADKYFKLFEEKIKEAKKLKKSLLPHELKQFKPGMRTANKMQKMFSAKNTYHSELDPHINSLIGIAHKILDKGGRSTAKMFLLLNEMIGIGKVLSRL